MPQLVQNETWSVCVGLTGASAPAGATLIDSSVAETRHNPTARVRIPMRSALSCFLNGIEIIVCVG